MPLHYVTNILGNSEGSTVLGHKPDLSQLGFEITEFGKQYAIDRYGTCRRETERIMLEIQRDRLGNRGYQFTNRQCTGK